MAKEKDTKTAVETHETDTGTPTGPAFPPPAPPPHRPATPVHEDEAPPQTHLPRRDDSTPAAGWPNWVIALLLLLLILCGLSHCSSSPASAAGCSNPFSGSAALRRAADADDAAQKALDDNQRNIDLEDARARQELERALHAQIRVAGKLLEDKYGDRLGVDFERGIIWSRASTDLVTAGAVMTVVWDGGRKEITPVKIGYDSLWWPPEGLPRSTDLNAWLRDEDMGLPPGVRPDNKWLVTTRSGKRRLAFQLREPTKAP